MIYGKNCYSPVKFANARRHKLCIVDICTAPWAIRNMIPLRQVWPYLCAKYLCGRAAKYDVVENRTVRANKEKANSSAMPSVDRSSSRSNNQSGWRWQNRKYTSMVSSIKCLGGKFLNQVSNLHKNSLFFNLLWGCNCGWFAGLRFFILRQDIPT